MYCKKCAFCWFVLHVYITMHGSENLKSDNNLQYVLKLWYPKLKLWYPKLKLWYPKLFMTHYNKYMISVDTGF